MIRMRGKGEEFDKIGKNDKSKRKNKNIRLHRIVVWKGGFWCCDNTRRVEKEV